MSDLIGKKLGHYRLDRVLGQGGFAVVYRGEHVHLKTLAAIKVLHQVQLSSEEEEKFRKEAKTIANLKHPNIIGVLDYGIQESTSTPYLVMEYAPRTLKQRHPPGTRLSPRRILPYVKQVADALQYAHRRQIVHRDVKPENMLLDANNQVRLSDFGIAVVHETSRASKTQDKLGTPPYMAPEQFQGKALPASDQYSLGIVVYEWLCGSRPFTGSIPELMRQHESAMPSSMRAKVPSLSPAIEEVVMKALAKNPDERYERIWDFFLAFQQACQGEQAGDGAQDTIAVPSQTPQSRIPIAAGKGRAMPFVATPPEDSSVIWNVPYRRNMFFTDHTGALTLLHDTFHSGKAANRTQAVSGLGGIGKTQIALEYVYRYHSDYEVILWVRGDTRDKMLSDIATLAVILKLKEQRNLTEAVQSWLRKNTKWLLVIDNIEDLKLVQTLLPATAKGHILLTTRSQTTGNIARSIDLEKMTLEEGTLFLLRRTKILAQDATLQDAAPVDYQGAKAIAEVLDGLPLALDQAGAYIEETGCNLSSYLKSYQTGRKKLLNRRGGFDFDHPASVTATFSSSLEKIEKISPAAVELLRFCAFLHPDAIPEELIIDGAIELGPTLQPVATEPFLLDEVVTIMRRFSLVRRNSATNTLSVHPLVQAVLQDSMSEKVQQIWVERTVRAVNRTLPDVSEFFMWQRCQRYMPHVQNCVTLIEERELVSPEAARLLEQTGIYLQVQAQFKQADNLFERASAMRRQLTGEEPETSVAFLNHRFWHYYYQGQYAQAEQPIIQALRLLQQTPGSDQQSIAACLGAAAHLFYQQGKFSQAEDYFLQALAIYEEHVGLQHPSAVCTFSGLGNIALALARYDRAERFFWDALNIWQQMPEPQHPLMCTSLNGLAQVSLARGKYAQTEHYLQQERAHLERTLQPLHPAVARNLNDWASLFIAQGKYDQVEPLLRQSLTMLEQMDALQHPIAGRTFDRLGSLSYVQGKYKQNMNKYAAAEQFFQKAQSISEHALGVDHPDILATINNLADVYTQQFRLSLAEELYNDVLAARTRILGAEHPAVAQTLHSMAQLSYTRSQYDDTERLYNEALAIRKKALGPEHPDVARSLYGLGLLYYLKWQRFKLAESHLQRALAIYEKAQLSEHPEVGQILATYSGLLLVLNRMPEAAEAKARAKTILAKLDAQE